MSMQKDRITDNLEKIGAAWATSADKHIHQNDPMEDQINQVKTYHIHPDQTYPHSDSIQRFHSLRELEGWIREQLNREESLGFKRDQPESIPFLATLYDRTHKAFYAAAGRGRLEVWRSDSLTWSTRAAVEEYLRTDRRRRENKTAA